MNLKIQIITLIYSFIYGIIFSLLLNLNYKYIYQGKKIFRIILTFIFVLDNMLLYFLILKKINYGILHIYEFLAIIFGFIIENTLFAKLYKK